MKRRHDTEEEEEEEVSVNLPDEMWLEILGHVFPYMHFYVEDMREALNARHISRHLRSLLDTQVFAKMDAFSGSALEAVRDTELLLFKRVDRLVMRDVKWLLTGATLREMSWLKSLAIFDDLRCLPRAYLTELTQLKELRLYEPTNAHKCSLRVLTQLESLRLVNNRVIDDMDMLRLTRLTQLCLIGDTRMTGSYLSGLSSLRRVKFYYTKSIGDAQLLPMASRLESLKVDSYNNISNDCLRQMTRLTELILDGNKSITGDTLRALTCLNSLKLVYETCISDKDLTSLSSLTRLCIRESPAIMCDSLLESPTLRTSLVDVHLELETRLTNVVDFLHFGQLKKLSYCCDGGPKLTTTDYDALDLLSERGCVLLLY